MVISCAAPWMILGWRRQGICRACPTATHREVHILHEMSSQIPGYLFEMITFIWWSYVLNTIWACCNSSHISAGTSYSSTPRLYPYSWSSFSSFSNAGCWRWERIRRLFGSVFSSIFLPGLTKLPLRIGGACLKRPFGLISKRYWYFNFSMFEQ